MQTIIYNIISIQNTGTRIQAQIIAQIIPSYEH